MACRRSPFLLALVFLGPWLSVTAVAQSRISVVGRSFSFGVDSAPRFYADKPFGLEVVVGRVGGGAESTWHQAFSAAPGFRS